MRKYGIRGGIDHHDLLANASIFSTRLRLVRRRSKKFVFTISECGEIVVALSTDHSFCVIDVYKVQQSACRSSDHNR